MTTTQLNKSKHLYQQNIKFGCSSSNISVKIFCVQVLANTRRAMMMFLQISKVRPILLHAAAEGLLLAVVAGTWNMSLGWWYLDQLTSDNNSRVSRVIHPNLRIKLSLHSPFFSSGSSSPRPKCQGPNTGRTSGPSLNWKHWSWSLTYLRPFWSSRNLLHTVPTSPIQSFWRQLGVQLRSGRGARDLYIYSMPWWHKKR